MLERKKIHCSRDTPRDLILWDGARGDGGSEGEGEGGGDDVMVVVGGGGCN